MDDRKRTKLLAIGLGAVVAVYSGRSAVSGWIFGPINDLQKKLRTAQTQGETLADRQIALGVAQRNLKDWKNISLPSDIDDAQRLYREWVFELARQCGFSGPAFEVTPGARSAQKEYSTVSVEVRKAETDLQGLVRFLYLFDQAGLLQRISSMKIDSPGAQGNPRLNVSFAAEGMSVEGTENRPELLPRTKLSGALSETATAMKAVPSELFPTADGFEPFLVRLERELIRITAINGDAWTIERGAAGTKAAAHTDQSTVELFPVVWDRREITIEQFVSLVKDSPFVIPSAAKTWNPKVAGVTDRTIRPGEEVKMTARADGINPELGAATFAITEAAEGMAIDPATGEFTWKPDEKLEPGKYKATVILTQANAAENKINTTVTITIQQPNAAPVLTLPKSGLVIIGREFSVQPTAQNDNATETLSYALGTGAPEGLQIDAKTGLLKWTPARSFTPGKYDVTVTVKDSGTDSKSTSAVISLDVQDDHAAMTLLSGTVSRDGVWYAWLRNKGTGVTTRPKVGDAIQISEVSADILSITNRFITMKDAAGVWKLELGEGLRDRKLIEPAAQPPETPATAAAAGNADYDANPAASSPNTDAAAAKSPGTPQPGTPQPAVHPPATEQQPEAGTQPANQPSETPGAPTENPPAATEQPNPPQQP